MPQFEQSSAPETREITPPPLVDGTVFDLHLARADLAKYVKTADQSAVAGPALSQEVPLPQPELSGHEKVNQAGHNIVELRRAAIKFTQSDLELAA